jgi:hypothetical protein
MGILIATVVGLAVFVAVFFVAKIFKARSSATGSDEKQRYLVVQFQTPDKPAITDEQVQFACKHSIDLLHNSLVHGRDMRSPVQRSVTSGAFFGRDIIQIESYLKGTFRTLIDRISDTQGVVLYERQKDQAFLQLATLLTQDKPLLYAGVLDSLPPDLVAVRDRLQADSSDTTAFSIGEKNASELITHLADVGPTPDTSQLMNHIRLVRKRDE